MDASSRQPGRRYSFAQHGNSEQGQRPGVYLVQNNAADIWNVAWSGGTTTLRILPTPGFPGSGQQFEPYRMGPGANEFGDWIRSYPAVRNFGNPGVTCIIGNQAAATVEDRFSSPAWVLHSAIDRAVRAGQDRPGWAATLRGAPGKGALLSKPSQIYLLQACIIKHKTKIYNPPAGLAPDARLIVMALASSAGAALVAQLNMLREGYQGPQDDYENMFANGDPISLAYGRYITWYNLQDGDPRLAQAAPAQIAQPAWNMNARVAAADSGGSDEKGYGCYLEQAFQGYSANFSTFAPHIAQKTKHWDDILFFPTPDEQARYFADKFPPEMIAFAWRDHPHWLPDHVRQAAVGHVSAPTGGAVPGQFAGMFLPPVAAIPSIPGMPVYGGGMQPMVSPPPPPAFPTAPPTTVLPTVPVAPPIPQYPPLQGGPAAPHQYPPQATAPAYQAGMTPPPPQLQFQPTMYPGHQPANYPPLIPTAQLPPPPPAQYPPQSPPPPSHAPRPDPALPTMAMPPLPTTAVPTTLPQPVPGAAAAFIPRPEPDQTQSRAAAAWAALNQPPQQ